MTPPTRKITVYDDQTANMVTGWVTEVGEYSFVLVCDDGEKIGVFDICWLKYADKIDKMKQDE